MNNCEICFSKQTLDDDSGFKYFERSFPSIKMKECINVAHNYAAFEEHFNSEVLVHRKGAIRAEEGEICIIPGSQQSHSYIVKGKGNVESFKSSSHGAGRVLGRKEAIKTLNLQSERNQLEEKGILHSLTNQKDLDEAPSAYKNIDDVIQDLKNLTDLFQIQTFSCY